MEFGLSSGVDMGLNEDYDPEYVDPDTCLSPVERLEKYLESEHTFSRQLAARTLLDTLHQIDKFTDAQRVLKTVLTLANDPDGIVRAELCEQLVQIGNFCYESQKLFTNGDIFHDPLSKDILPIAYRFMTDPNSQVRKTSQAALSDLVELKLVTTEDIVYKVSPIVSKLADYDASDDHRSEAATLICNLAPSIGAKLMEQLFLTDFVNLCTDPVFQTRKICAVNFGSVCQAMGREKTESILLWKFLRLCGDVIWGVRKACTECFMQVSLVCSPAYRHSHLSAVFINLVSDQSRWVRMAAFEALGGFISTFANPRATGLSLTEDGALVLSEPSTIQDIPRINGETSDNSGAFPLKDVSHKDSIKFDHPNELPTTTLMFNEAVDPGPTTNPRPGTAKDGTTNEGFVYEDDAKETTDDAESPDSNTVSDLQSQGFNYADDNSSSLLKCLADENLPVDGKGEQHIKNDMKNFMGNNSGHSASVTENNELENEECKLNITDNLNESLDKDGVRRNMMVEGRDQNVEISANQTEEAALFNGFVDNAFHNCELKLSSENASHCHAISGIDMLTLDMSLENNSNKLTAEKMTEQFSLLKFFQHLVPELSESHSDAIGDNIIQHCIENCMSLNDVAPDNNLGLLNSKLLDSVSHLCTDLSDFSKPALEASQELENFGGVTSFEITDESNVGDANKTEVESSTKKPKADIFQNIKPSLGNSALYVADKFEDLRNISEETEKDTRMECDDNKNLRISRISRTVESKISAPLSELETEEIPLDSDFSRDGCSLGNGTYRPLLQMLDESTDSDNSAMDVGEDFGLENSIEVNENEVYEPVAAAKYQPSDITIYEQDVVPRDLLEQYLGMMDPSCAQKVDSEITRHCAYSLPAVAYTLGRKNWPSLKNLYAALAVDVQWKVRRTLAFSIHELAMIVGEEITIRDLVPVFDGFLNDLDEVRIGVLKHLADFLKLLSPESRCGYLLKIAELLKTDNSRNWRFREELARQLYLLLNLFTVSEILEHVAPIALHLADDRVAQVRLAAIKVLSRVLKQLADEREKDDGRMMWLSYQTQLKEQFAQHRSCLKRQMYVQLCSCILEDEIIDEERFATDFLPTLLLLHCDSIPNVRLTLARTLAQNVTQSEYFKSAKNPCYNELMQAVASLQEDKDRDVRHLIGETTHRPPSPPLDI